MVIVAGWDIDRYDQELDALVTEGYTRDELDPNYRIICTVLSNIEVSILEAKTTTDW